MPRDFARSKQERSVLRATITLDGKLIGTDDESLDGAACRQRLLASEIDELHLTVRAQINGRAGADTLSGPPTAEFFPRSIALRLIEMETCDGECLLRYKVRSRRPANAGAVHKVGMAGRAVP